MNLVRIYNFNDYYLFHYKKDYNIYFRKFVFEKHKLTNYVNYGVPNIVTYNSNFNLKVERFYNKDEILHNAYGPAYITYKDNKFCFLDFVYDGIQYTNEVKNWVSENNINWQEMTESDYNRMWFEILD